MFRQFNRADDPDDSTAGDRGGTGRAETTGASDRDLAARQQVEFGGVNWGAAFFGWLVAVGLGVILTALFSAAGAAVGLSSGGTASVKQNAATLSLIGGIILLVVLMIAYYSGGYVAGRMSRFDGGRQGAAVWAFGLIVTIILAVVGAVAGSQYNVLGQLNLPSIPVKGSELAAGGAIALVAILIGTLVASVLGGKAGQRYHRKVDRVGTAR